MNSMIYKKKSPLLIFLIPAFAFLLLFLYYPFFQNIINTFFKIGGLGRSPEGLNTPWYENYQRLFTDPYMRVALKNTLLLTLCTIVFQVGIALILALLVDTIRVGAKFFRVVYFFPIVISATALGLMFNLIFLYKGGMVNQLLLSLGKLETEVKPSGKVIVQWLDWKDQAHFLFTMFLPVMWQYVGFYFVILVTGLNNIPEDLYEAAALDGADGWKRTRFITLPLLGRTTTFVILMTLISYFQMFAQFSVLLFKDGPQNSGLVLTSYIYENAFIYKEMGYAAALSVVLFLLILIVSLVQQRINRVDWEY